MEFSVHTRDHRRQEQAPWITRHNSQFRRKVSRAFLGNGGFAESKSGDWFDIALNSRIPAFIGRMKAARVLHN
jgi:hypothetical protein